MIEVLYELIKMFSKSENQKVQIYFLVALFGATCFWISFRIAQKRWEFLLEIEKIKKEIFLKEIELKEKTILVGK